MAGVTICPGDFIFGDADGTVIIPKDIAESVLDEALMTVEKENSVRGMLSGGISLQEAYAKVGAI